MSLGYTNQLNHAETHHLSAGEFPVKDGFRREKNHAKNHHLRPRLYPSYGLMVQDSQDFQDSQDYFS